MTGFFVVLLPLVLLLPCCCCLPMGACFFLSHSKVRVAKDIAIQMCDVLDGGEYVGVLNAPNMAAARKSKLTSYVSLGERMGALQAQLLGQGKVQTVCCFVGVFLS